MADPVGELERMIREAFAHGPETMDVADAARFLAERLEPDVVLRAQIEHCGWDGERATFFVPSRNVVGTANLEIEWNAN